MAVNLSPVYGVAGQVFDNNGNPLAGGKIYTYLAGTTTNAVTYTSSNGATAHSNPIVLDGAGRVPTGEIWLTDGITYKFVIQDYASNLIGSYDNLSGINSNFINFTNEQEIQTATAGQTVFTLTTMQYQPGTNSLSVFVDGVNQYGSGAQYAYIETSGTTVTFTTGLHVGAEVKFTTSSVNASSYGDAFQISYTPPFTASVPTNVGDKLAQYVSVIDFGVVADDESVAASNDVAIAFAIASGFPLYWPKGTYTFASTIKVGAPTLNQPSPTFKWRGAGIGETILQPALSFTDNKFIFVENSTVDFSPAAAVYDAVVEDMTLNGRNDSLGIRYGMYWNWPYFCKINRVHFYSWRDVNASTGLFMGAWNSTTETYGMVNTISDCHFDTCNWGVIFGGYDQELNPRGDINASNIINTRVAGTGQIIGVGIEFRGGYSNSIRGCDIENNLVGVLNREGYNWITDTLTEQNPTDVDLVSGFLAASSLNAPLPSGSSPDTLGRGQIFGRHGYVSTNAIVGGVKNRIVDGTFETKLYESAVYGGQVIAVASDTVRLGGAYGRNVFYAQGGSPSSTTRAALVVDSAQNYFQGWYTVLIRAKSYNTNLPVSIYVEVPTADYSESIGAVVVGAGNLHNILEIGAYSFVGGAKTQSADTDNDWRMYMAHFHFDGATITNLPISMQGADYGVIDFVGLFEGTCAYIPGPTTEIETSVDIGSVSPGNSVTIVDFNCYPTAVGLEIDSLSLDAIRRIAGLYHNLENGTGAGYSYNTALNNTWGYSTANTASNDHLYVNTQSKVSWFQRASAYPSGTTLQTRIKILPF